MDLLSPPLLCVFLANSALRPFLQLELHVQKGILSKSPGEAEPVHQQAIGSKYAKWVLCIGSWPGLAEVRCVAVCYVLEWRWSSGAADARVSASRCLERSLGKRNLLRKAVSS